MHVVFVTEYIVFFSVVCFLLIYLGYFWVCLMTFVFIFCLFALVDLFGCACVFQGGEHDCVSVGQPASPVPADAAARGPHFGLRARPHPLLGDGRHPDLRLIQSGLGSGSGGGRRHQGAQSQCVVRVHGEVRASP